MNQQMGLIRIIEVEVHPNPTEEEEEVKACDAPIGEIEKGD